MKKWGFFVALLLTISLVLGIVTADKCKFGFNKVMIGIPNCSYAEPLESTKLYIHENFYICGELQAKTGKITAYNKNIVPNQTVEVREGSFSIKGYSNTEQHKVYYINLVYINSKNESCELQPIVVEVLDKCNEVAPALRIIEGDVVEEGNNFTIEISAPEKDYNLTISGLSNKIVATLKRGETWRRSFSSKQCCENPPCSCRIQLNFVDSKHSICKDSAILNVNIRKKTNKKTEVTNSLPTLVVITLVIIGTGFVLFLNRK